MSRLIGGRYAVGPEVRRGGMSEVYKAFDTATSQQVAVKMFSAGRIDDDVIREAFQRELRALTRLKHPGIVTLYDFGVDESGRSYLILDWVESDVSQLPLPAFKAWDGYFTDLGLPILEALAYAHANGVVHRDINPRNILRGVSGPLIADFGVSKLKSWLEPSITLQHFRSAPFSAPETNVGDYEYSRDVFSYAAVTLQCLSDKRLVDYPDLYDALDQVHWSDDVHDVFRRSLSDKPSVRQQNAQILLGELRRLTRNEAPAKRRRLHFVITRKGSESLVLLGCRTQDAMERRVSEELSGDTVFESYRGSGEMSGTHLFAYGASLSFHLALRDDGYSLAVVNVRDMPQALLEQRRDVGCLIPTTVAFSTPADVRRAELDITELLAEVAGNDSARNAAQLLAEEEAIIVDWARLLSVKEEIDRERQEPLPYSAVAQDGNRLRFTIDTRINEGIVGQERVVEVNGRTGIAGEVEDVSGDELTLISGERSHRHRAPRLQEDPVDGRDEARELLRKAVAWHLEAMIADGQAIPLATTGAEELRPRSGSGLTGAVLPRRGADTDADPPWGRFSARPRCSRPA